MFFHVLIWKNIMYFLWNCNVKRLIIQSDRQHRHTYKELSIWILLASISGLTVYLLDWNIIIMRLISTRPRITQSVEWLSYGLEDRRIVFRFPVKSRTFSFPHCLERLWIPPNPCWGTISSAVKAVRVRSWKISSPITKTSTTRSNNCTLP